MFIITVPGATKYSALVLGVSVAVSSIATFLLGALLTSVLVICLCYIPRRLKAPQTSTSTSGNTSAPLPLVPDYEELTTSKKIEMEGNAAYALPTVTTSKEIEMEGNAAYALPTVTTSKEIEMEGNAAYALPTVTTSKEIEMEGNAAYALPTVTTSKEIEMEGNAAYALPTVSL